MTSLQKDTEFKSWVNQYSDLLYQYAVRQRFDTDTAKDLVQETFLAAWRNIENYKGQASVKNWLFIILKNKIKDHFRKASNKVAVESIQQEYNDERYFDTDEHWAQGYYPSDWSVNFSNGLETKEFYNIFKTCSKKLKEIQHAVFVMKFIDCVSSEEICKALEITASNYWIIIHRAKVQLRNCLQRNWVEK